MSIQPVIHEQIDIHADAAVVWKTLTDPEATRQYMYGCAVDSDWQVGSPVLWRMPVDGTETVVVQGTVLALEPQRLLRYTVFDPTMGIPDIPENYLTVSYELSTTGQTTTLHVAQGDYTTVANGEERYRHTVGVWAAVLAQIKQIAEQS